MDFFTAQDAARRKTGRLVVLMIAAVLALIATTTLAVLIAFHFLKSDRQRASASLLESLLAGLSPQLVGVVALGVLLLVGLGGLYKQSQLRRGGGKAVAEALGGREIPPDTEEGDERRILNVVEEMAIASGTPVPPVYLLDEGGINAFAAGFDTRDAVVGITRGAIQHLTRDQLQGVVAHEFSHILYGDMRLNMRLISVLHGVLLIGLAGHILLRSAPHRGALRSNKRNDSAAVLIGLGAALALIGVLGTFFGNWIKAAVSRQREYLADASAVQYTRNPNGIGHALVKIGSHTQGARLDASRAGEYSHMLFGPAIRLSFNRLLATHPPLEKRIARVLPGWNGQFDATLAHPGARASDAAQAGAAGFQNGSSWPATGQCAAREAVAAMGQPDPRHLAQASATLSELPERLQRAARTPYAARALMYALLLSKDSDVRKRQLAGLRQRALADVYREVMTHAGEVVTLDARFRLPLMELSLPALKGLSKEQAEHFKSCLVELINADHQVSLFEWTLFRWLAYHLGFDERDRLPSRKLAELSSECAVVLGVLASAGQHETSEVAKALAAAEAELPFDLPPPGDDFEVKTFARAVSALRKLKPREKATVLEAMARCIEHSGRMTPVEAELFRVIGDLLECPVPPLLFDA
ncbi:M48 family metallopeptidase [Vreelandella malpeensis]|uniref:M48 family metallopeptidase n=1 Tax=Vreelandella malpeensis TaxID=1172368 RepID=A0ABS8DUQ0_9GAMM|nr:M48 family metallopeptidase [Halomonas malpeensis]MCB8890049.1 M48 family metallopeptidase [Halomonas malpeensis]